MADLLRGDYKQADCGEVILHFTLLRRLDCVLEPILKRKSKEAFYNVSPFKFTTLLDDQKHIRQNLIAYIGDFSEDARDVFERFRFVERIGELDDKNLLYLLVQKFAAVDLHPKAVPNETMGLVFEELIRKFAKTSNETAGKHFTPREVIKMIVHCLFAGDDEAIAKPGVVRSIYDPAAGTGGILSIAETVARERSSGNILELGGGARPVRGAASVIKIYGKTPLRFQKTPLLSG